MATQTIKEQLEAKLRQARLDRDEPTKTVIGMLKNNVLTELKSGKGVTDDEELWRKVVAAYAKQITKAIGEFEKAGERGQSAIEDLRFELGFCEQFLPSKLDEAATETLVRAKAAELSISDPKMMGKLMGALMKTHRDQLDGDLARKIVQRVLAED